MKGKKKFILTLAAIFFLFILFQLLLYVTRSDAERDEQSLMNQYYTLVKKDPEAAKRALDIIIKQFPHSQTAFREQGYYYLRLGDTHNAVKSFAVAIQNDPTDMATTLELAKLYQILGQNDKAASLLLITSKSKDASARLMALPLIAQLPKDSFKMPVPEKTPTIVNTMALFNVKHDYTPIAAPDTVLPPPPTPVTSKPAIAQGTMSERDKLLNEFYQNKKKNPQAAWKAIITLINKYPNDVTALKEAGFYALAEKNNVAAICYLYRAYEISLDPKLALQNGYILDNLKERKQAFNAFYLATQTKNTEDRIKAENAMTNLSGAQMKVIPDPFFFEFYDDPFHYSRFQLLVHPLVARFGLTISEKANWVLYTSYRRTADNRTELINGLPQIYDDSVVIYALGMRMAPFKSIPIAAFVEGGRAQDLIYRNRGRWRPDFRSGIAFFKDWGRETRYTLHPSLPMIFVADIYADAVYYSRYRNYIFTFRARPGFEIYRFGTSSLTLYFRAFLSEDTQREFFNNFFEYGLGLRFIPTDRLNLAARFEFTQGHYLPAAGPSVNPYGLNYHNNLVGMNIFLRF